MGLLESVGVDGYIFFESIGRIIHELVARNVNDGSIIAVLFNNNRKGCFFFYDYDYSALQWTGYAIKKMPEYKCYDEWNVAKIQKLYAQIKAGTVEVVRKDTSQSTDYSFFKDSKGLIHIPEPPFFPFFFQNDLIDLPPFENRQRFPYEEPPEYIVVIEHEITFQAVPRKSWGIYGTNKKSLYDSIKPYTYVDVAGLCCKSKAFAKFKFKNVYGIIPRFNCVGITRQ